MTRKRFYIIRINKNDADTYASPYGVSHAIEMAQPDAGDVIEWAQVYAADAGAARLKKPAEWKPLHV